MKKSVVIRIISFLALALYAAGIIYYLLYVTPAGPHAVQFKDLRATGFIDDGLYIEYINEYVDYLLAFIPAGLLIPLIRGRRSLNAAIICSLLYLMVIEGVKYFCLGGIISIDDEIWAVAGVITGYGFYSPVCVMAGLQDEFLAKRDFGGGWFVMIFVFALSVMCLKYESDKRAYEAEEPASDEIREELTEDTPQSVSGAYASYADPEVYDRLYEELKAYGSRIVFSNTTLTSEELFDTYLKLLNEHPELFYLTGGARVEILTYGDDTTLTFIPEYADDTGSIKDMEAELNAAADSYIAGCPGGTEYDKALWVHDRIVEETGYDSDVLFYAQSVEGSHFDHAYTAYGALVEHKAVCAGYARAYQLILTRLGIECGYVTGNAVNSFGENEAHAWNYIRPDGFYYYTDVTWDDPVNEDFTDMNKVSHDYFCLSSVDMNKDHFPDPNQFLPVCPETRSPY